MFRILFSCGFGVWGFRVFSGFRVLGLMGLGFGGLGEGVLLGGPGIAMASSFEGI